MKVFVAGATGAIGRPLVDALLAAGHDVAGTTRSPERALRLNRLGAEGITLDARDTGALRRAILAASPEVVVQELTDLSAPLVPKHYAEWLRSTNELRNEVTPSLVRAARDAGARRVIAQSVAFMTAPEGMGMLDEEAPLYLDAPAALLAAIRANMALERTVTEARGIEGLVLRYGFFYGPGTSYAPDGDVVRAIRQGTYPIVGTGAGRFPFVHVDDAAAATVRALDHGSPGVYNVVGDDPPAMRDWVTFVANIIGAPRPDTVTLTSAAHDLGDHMSYYGALLHGASNAKARDELQFVPRHPDWRDGFRSALQASEAVETR